MVIDWLNCRQQILKRVIIHIWSEFFIKMWKCYIFTWKRMICHYRTHKKKRSQIMLTLLLLVSYYYGNLKKKIKVHCNCNNNKRVKTKIWISGGCDSCLQIHEGLLLQKVLLFSFWRFLINLKLLYLSLARFQQVYINFARLLVK